MDKNNEPTINDVLEAVNDFSVKVDERFNKVDERFNKVDDRFNKVDERFEHLEQKVDFLDQKIDQNHLELLGYIRMIETELADIKERLTRLEKRTIEDADATAGDVLKLQRRLETADEEIKIVKNQIRQIQAV